MPAYSTAPPISLIRGGNSAGAVDDLVAALHLDIRVGADHWQLASGEAGQLRCVVGWRLDGVIPEAGAHDGAGIFLGDEPVPSPSNNGRSRSGPIWKTGVSPSCAMRPRETSPELTIASQAVRGTPILSSASATLV